MSEIVNFDPSGLADGDLSAQANWEKHKTDGPEIVIVGGVLKNGTPGTEATAQHTDVHTADQYAEITLSGVKNANRAGIILAAQTPDTAQDFYMSHMTFTAENVMTLRAAKKIAGTYDGLTLTNAAFNDDSVFRAVRAGDSIIAFVDGQSKLTYTNGTASQLPDGQPGIVMEDGSTIEIPSFVSGNVLSATNTITKTASDLPDYSHPTNAAVSQALVDTLGNPKFSSSGTITKYRASGLPPGITMDESTGVMSGTPTTEGVYGVSAWAEDDQGWLDGQSFEWTITTGAEPTPSVALDAQPAYGTSETPATISGSYSAFVGVPTGPVTISDGVNSMDVAVTVTDNGDGTGTFTGTMPSLPAAGATGTGFVLLGDVDVSLDDPGV